MNKLPPIPKEIEAFTVSQLTKYALSGYRVIVHPSDKIKKGEMTYTGEATAENLEISIGGPWQDWIGVLVHETCHIDQHMADSDSFDLAENALERISSWLNGTTSSVSIGDFRTVLENEADCETRSVQKINENNLPIDVKDYIRRANAYLASYAVTFHHRVWIPQPYRNDYLCSLMPESEILSPSFILESLDKPVADEEFLRLVSKV